MTTLTAAAPPVPAISAGTEPVLYRILLRNIPWDLYVRLRDDEANEHTRMTYDQGRLELMSPGRRHEIVGKLLGRFINDWTVELDIAIRSGGHTTYRHDLLRRGLEPDECYCVEHEAEIRGRQEADLAVEPPPDLVIEVEVTSPLVPKIPIYEAMRVPEIWHWRDETIRVLRLTDNGYEQVDASVALPRFPLDLATRLLAERWVVSETKLDLQFRAAVRAK